MTKFILNDIRVSIFDGSISFIPVNMYISQPNLEKAIHPVYDFGTKKENAKILAKICNKKIKYDDVLKHPRLKVIDELLI